MAAPGHRLEGQRQGPGRVERRRRSRPSAKAQGRRGAAGPEQLHHEPGPVDGRGRPLSRLPAARSLRGTVRPGPAAGSGAAPTSGSTSTRTQPSARLAAGIADHLGDAGAGAPHGCCCVRTGEFLDPERPVGETGLVSGDELVLNPTARADAAAADPDPGRQRRRPARAPIPGTAPRSTGARYLLGRGDNCDIIVSDPTVSRSHLRVEVASRLVGHGHRRSRGRERPAGQRRARSTEPTTCRRRRRRDDRHHQPRRSASSSGPPTPPSTASARSSSTAPRTGPSGCRSASSTRSARHRPRPSAAASRSSRCSPRSAVGVMMFAITESAAVPAAHRCCRPVAMVGNWFEDRRSGRQRHVEAVEKYRREDRGPRKVEIADALAEERVERVRSAPDLADLARRAELRTIDLWPRGRDAARLPHRPARARRRPEPGGRRGRRSNGDDELRDELAEAAGRARPTRRRPDHRRTCAEVGVLGVHGDPTEVDDVAASIALQAACLHSPEDLIIAAAVGPDRSFADWLKWLPQARSATTPLAGSAPHHHHRGRRAACSPSCVEVAELRTRGREPTASTGAGPGCSSSSTATSIPTRPSCPSCSSWCPRRRDQRACGSAPASRGVPRQAAAVVDCQLGRGGPGHAVAHRPRDRRPRTSSSARSTPTSPTGSPAASPRCATPRSPTPPPPSPAPPRCSASSARSTPTPPGWSRRWLTNRPYGLEHPVGLSADGVFSLDLVADGPHALIGGTSGAGKSELLQSMVASLITRLPADPPQLPVRRLQGRRLVDGVQGRAPHRRLRHQPRRRPGPAGAHVAAGRAQPPHARSWRAGPRTSRRCWPSTPTTPRRRWSSWSTSSPRWSRRSPTSSPASSTSPSAAGASASTSCSPPSGRRAR